MSKALKYISGFFILSIIIFISLSVYMPKEYLIKDSIFIANNKKTIKNNMSDFKNWNKWFAFNSKNSNISITDNNYTITTSKNKKIVISNLRVKDNKISFVISTTLGKTYGVFTLGDKQINGVLKGKIDKFFGGYINVFFKSSLQNILNISLLNLANKTK